MTDGKVNILLVDDKPERVLALEAVLESLGQNIVRAFSGREALRALLQQEFAVILLDVNMPGMDGFETASLIRQRSEEHTSELQSQSNLVCRLLLEKKKKKQKSTYNTSKN